MNIFITGVSSGIGYELAKLYLANGFRVYGVSRSDVDIEHKSFYFQNIDLSKLDDIEKNLKDFLPNDLKLVVLNAGILGDIKLMQETSLQEINNVFNVNVWANKLILDTLQTKQVKQVAAISSGAAVNGSKGWSSYSLSKATLNMLVKLYAAQMPNTHLSSVAPGLILTKMLKHIIEEVDAKKFTSVQRLQQSNKKTPQQSAKQLFETFPKLLMYESGAFVDVRNM
jgi:NAD(P)-dependent dehydrogenase (short-subunit alcohol dehydrogenase family)